MMPAVGPFELIVNSSDWDRALRPLLLDSTNVAVSNVRWNPQPTSTELLVRDVELRNTPPTGNERPQHGDWVVWTVERDSHRSPADWFGVMQPRPTQTVVVVSLSADDHSRWDGIVWHEGAVRPLQAVRVIGPGMLHLRRRSCSKEEPISDVARVRWSRTMGALGENLWLKVRDAHVLLIGCGRNGTLLAWQLACLGVSTLTLVDGDRIALENLDAMPGLHADDVGRYKVDALARRLVEFQPDLTVRGFCLPATEAVDRLQSRFDLIVTCVDDDTPRLVASWLSRELLIPHLDVGTSVRRPNGRLELGGDVRLMLPFEACVGCIGGLADREATLYEFAAPVGSLHRGEPTVWSRQRAGSLVHLNAMAVGAAVELWLSLLRAEIGSFWQRLTWRTETGLQADGGAVAGMDCPFCRPS